MSDDDQAAIETFYRALRSSTARKKRTARRPPGDVQRVDQVMSDVVSDQGWEARTAGAQALVAWPEIVGAEVAAHVQAERCVDGTLFVRADSTTWANQIRLLAPHIVERCQELLEEDLITAIDVTGPAAPSWVKGPRRVRGRGPRDTYG